MSRLGWYITNRVGILFEEIHLSCSGPCYWSQWDVSRTHQYLSQEKPQPSVIVYHRNQQKHDELEAKPQIWHFVVCCVTVYICTSTSNTSASLQNQDVSTKQGILFINDLTRKHYIDMQSAHLFVTRQYSWCHQLTYPALNNNCI